MLLTHCACSESDDPAASYTLAPAAPSEPSERASTESTRGGRRSRCLPALVSRQPGAAEELKHGAREFMIRCGFRLVQVRSPTAPRPLDSCPRMGLLGRSAAAAAMARGVLLGALLLADTAPVARAQYGCTSTECCRTRCRASGWCCNAALTESSNHMFSCLQACAMRVQGDSAALVVRRCHSTGAPPKAPFSPPPSPRPLPHPCFCVGRVGRDGARVAWLRVQSPLPRPVGPVRLVRRPRAPRGAPQVRRQRGARAGPSPPHRPLLCAC